MSRLSRPFGHNRELGKKRLSKLWTPLSLVLAVVIILFTAQILPVDASIGNWVIAGNKVFLNNQDVYLSVKPHTITSSGWVEFELLSKNYNGDIDAVWGFTENITPSSPQIWTANASHIKYRTVVVEREATSTIVAIENFVKLNWGEYGGEPDIGNRNNTHLYEVTADFSEIGLSETKVVAFNTYSLDGNTATITYNYDASEQEQYVEYYDDWVPIPFNISRSSISHLGCDKWFFVKSATIETGKTYKIRCWLDVPFSGFNKSSGKYVWGVKPSAETLTQAKANGHLYLLDPWYNTQWLYRRQLTFDNTASTEDLTNFRVYVSLNATNFDFSHCQADGDDIWFIDEDDSTECKVFDAYWDLGNQTAIFVVQVPQIDAAVNTDFIYMYYGNSGAADQEDYDWGVNPVIYAPLWSDRQKGSPFNTPDRYTHALTVSGATWSSQGRVYTNDYIVAPDDAAFDWTTDLSIFGWLQVTDKTAVAQCLAGKYQTTVNNREWYVNKYNTNGRIQFVMDDDGAAGNTGNAYTNAEYFVNNTWLNVATTYNGTPLIYANGASVPITIATAFPAACPNLNSDLLLGAQGSDLGNRLTGILGELWITDDLESGEEIEAYYLTSRHLFGGANDFVIFGAEEGEPLPPTNFTAWVSNNNIDMSWLMGLRAENVTIVAGDSHFPTSRSDGIVIYNGNGLGTVEYGAASELGPRYYSAWSWSEWGFSTDYATAQAGGEGMIYLFLSLLALGLTMAMFGTRNMLLGFPSAIFWGVLCGYSYTQSTATWDWQYFLFFASAGMIIFSCVAMYALRRRDIEPTKQDWEPEPGDKEIEEIDVSDESDSSKKRQSAREKRREERKKKRKEDRETMRWTA